MNPAVNIPSTWAHVKLGDIVDYGEGSKVEPSEINDGDWVLELEDIQKDTSKLLQRLSFFQRKSKSTKTRFNKGDILFGKLRPYLNKVIIADQNGFCTTEIVPLLPNKFLNSHFLFYWLKSPYFLNYVVSVSYGLNMPRLGTKDGRNAPFILAPLNEQKRIADKLDSLLARVDACCEHLERVPEIIKRFRQAVLAAAVSGRLTEDWRKTKKISIKSWVTRKGVDIFPFITSGSRGWASYYTETGAKFIRVGNLDHDTIDLDLSDLQHVTPPENAEGKRTRINVGDILISITADIGMVALIREDIGEAYINQHICLARQSGQYSDAYLAYYLASPIGLAQFINSQRGMTKLGLTLGDIKGLTFQIPEIEEQLEIVRRVDALFTYGDRLETRYQATINLVDKLPPALLAKAFRGELVPQDPNDDPASLLLEQIRIERKVQSETINQHPIKEKTKKTPKSEGLMRKLSEIKPTHLSDILKENGAMIAERLWRESDLSIDDFYEQLKDEEAKELLKEIRNPLNDMISLLEAL